jgi:hypothetical protein
MSRKNELKVKDWLGRGREDMGSGMKNRWIDGMPCQLEPMDSRRHKRGKGAEGKSLPYSNVCFDFYSPSPAEPSDNPTTGYSM